MMKSGSRATKVDREANSKRDKGVTMVPATQALGPLPLVFERSMHLSCWTLRITPGELRPPQRNYRASSITWRCLGVTLWRVLQLS